MYPRSLQRASFVFVKPKNVQRPGCNWTQSRVCCQLNTLNFGVYLICAQKCQSLQFGFLAALFFCWVPMQWTKFLPFASNNDQTAWLAGQAGKIRPFSSELCTWVSKLQVKICNRTFNRKFKSRAGHFRYSWIFSIIKYYFLHFLLS